MSDTPNPIPTGPAAGKPRRKWVRVIFALSLTMNLVVIGLVAGAHLGDRRDHGFDPRGPERGTIRDLGFGPIASALPREDRRAIGKALRNEKGSFKENRAAMRRDFDAMLAALRADPYDATALNTALEGQRDRMMGVGDTARQLILERIELMSLEDRRKFADDILHNMRGARR